LAKDDERNPAFSAMYRDINTSLLPLTESLKDTIARAVPYFEDVIKHDILAGKRVLIAAHGNSLRALVKYFENIPDDEIVNLNIPTGIPLVYELDNDFHVVKKYYLGDPEEIAAKMNSVANQGKVK
jgi:2,3-bisphosphoglycerate-dependent phosphoglycerate mutase